MAWVGAILVDFGIIEFKYCATQRDNVMCRETMPNSLFMVSMSGDWIVVSNRLTRWVGGLFKTQVWVLVHGLALHLILKPKWAEMVAIVAALFLRVTTDWGAFLLPANPDLTGIWRMGGLTCFSIFASSLRWILGTSGRWEWDWLCETLDGGRWQDWRLRFENYFNNFTVCTTFSRIWGHK